MQNRRLAIMLSTLLILSTSSNPETTLPITAQFPSSLGVLPIMIKNDEPLERSLVPPVPAIPQVYRSNTGASASS